MGRLLFFALAFHIITVVLCNQYNHSIGYDPNKYNAYSDIVSRLKELERNHDEVSLQAIGLTYEGRTLYLVKITGDPFVSKRGIFLEANSHAREWVTSAIALNLIDGILKKPSMLDLVDWYIIPMANPDGYEYSRKSGDKFWRKNRSLSRNSDCFGVDLNRNYPPAWGRYGSSKDRCDYEVYGGPYPLSEAETQAVATTLRRNRKKIDLFISAHSYGDEILYPYGYVKISPPNVDNLVYLANLMSAAIEKVSGTRYTVKQSVSLYPTSGSVDDFAYSYIGIPYVYTIEFTRGYGFNYPKYLLPELYKKTFAGFEAAADFIGRGYE